MNIKPNKAEKLLQTMQVPFSLKAGTVGQLEIKLSLMSMFSSDAQSLQLSLENVFFILGPSMRVISKDDSYLQESEQELLEPYDENNAFNVFTNNLKLRKKPSRANESSAGGKVDVSERKYHRFKETSTNSSMIATALVKEQVGLSKDQQDAVKGLTIFIKRLHLRYEDDYYSGESPYSFGVVIDVSLAKVCIKLTQ